MQIPKQEAEQIIKDIGILRILDSLGEAQVVGSVALDLIVKRDIDIHVVVEDLFSSIDHLSTLNRS
jgi:hypothetical protein